MAAHEDHSVEIIREAKWAVRVTVYGSTLTFPFEAEDYARSYADGQAFRLGVQVTEFKKSA
ncbi:hypothetical protein RFN25_31170 [Mesorhizobium abyssinicae]|uniref:hypothetical protein n=1 Tax=Mesorhizobium abyssinicae TaxID=1209958 RepID=UPI002A24738A|nr:hypothetical protein [Mesorhizobium abyssinicae]MDX8437859.1 hypothetical protein [Mesorhizobium abyssinicae]